MPEKQPKRKIMVTQTISNKSYIIDLGDRAVFIQRKYPINASDSQLTMAEKVICALCEHILKTI